MIRGYSTLREAEELERLAGRPLEAAIRTACEAVSGNACVWAEGLRGEAAALTGPIRVKTANERWLWVSPYVATQADRAVRYGHRLGAKDISQLPPTPPLPQVPLIVLASLQQAVEAEWLAACEWDGVVLEGIHGASPRSHDFDPSWRRIASCLKRARRLVLLAARCQRQVKEDVLDRLDLTQTPIVSVVAPLLAAESLRIEVYPATGGPLGMAREVLEAWPRPLLVAAQTPAEVDQSFQELREAQLPVHRLHAAMPATERAVELLQFTIPGRRALLAAQVSFGGPPEREWFDRAGAWLCSPERAAAFAVDAFGRSYRRGDLQSVLLLAPPPSLEQALEHMDLLGARGRTPDDSEAAAPDPVPAEPLHLVIVERPLPGSSNLESDSAFTSSYVEYVYDALEQRVAGLPLSEGALRRLAGDLQMTERKLRFALSLLVASGAVRRKGGLNQPDAKLVPHSREICASLCEDLAIWHEARLQAQAGVQMFLKASSTCRVATLARWFEGGEAEAAPCGVCDVCAPASRDEPIPAPGSREPKMNPERRTVSAPRSALA